MLSILTRYQETQFIPLICKSLERGLIIHGLNQESLFLDKKICINILFINYLSFKFSFLQVRFGYTQIPLFFF